MPGVHHGDPESAPFQLVDPLRRASKRSRGIAQRGLNQERYAFHGSFVYHSGEAPALMAGAPN